MIRLEEAEIQVIKEVFQCYFQKGDHIWLFGSRVEPHKKGGDIDLYIEPLNYTDEIAEAKRNFRVNLQERIGEQKIDIVIKRPGKHLYIYDVAKRGRSIIGMNEAIKLLKDCEDIADLHADRLQMALKHLHNAFPLTKIKMKSFSDEQLGYLELLTTRFSKLQNLIGGKIFTLILSSVGENVDTLTMVDKLNLLEKKEFLESVKKWKMLRDLRNDIAHDYPTELEH